MHVTLRSSFRPLRSQFTFPTLRSCLADVNRDRRRRMHARSPLREDFRVVHFSLQHDHVHLLVEARDKHALSNGLRGLAVSVTRRINALMRRRGRVFADRWHGRALTTPRAVRRCLVYVLQNWKKHEPRESRRAAFDVFSSAPYFTGFRGFRGLAPIARLRVAPRALAPPPHENPTRVEPTTWLLRVGWLRLGAIGSDEQPLMSPSPSPSPSPSGTRARRT